MKLIAVIPAYNEANTIAAVLEKTAGFVDEIIVVNDGSTDATQERARQAGVQVVTHGINRGLGAALGTGFEAAKRRGADVVVTLDADGQHDSREIPLLIESIRAGADLVIGSRLLTRKGMPWFRVCANVFGNIATFVLFGAWVSDSQSGLRALGPRALAQIVVRTNRMEVSSEIIAEAKRHGLILKEVPITAIYTAYSLSKGQSFFVGLKTLAKLFVRRLVG